MIQLKPYKIDIGERFGTLEVLSLAEAKRGRQRFRVGCTCSYAFIARGQDLRNGKAKCRRCAHRLQPGR